MDTSVKLAAQHSNDNQVARVIAWIGLALLTIAAAGMRLYRADESLWVDELHTAWTVSAAAENVAPRAAIGNQTPVYFYGVWAVTRIGGLHEWTLRLPSLVAGVALVPLVFLVLLRWTASRSAALLSAALVAIDPQFIFYSQEARPYAVAQLVALLQVFVLAELLRAPAGAERSGWRGQWMLRLTLVSSTVLLFYLHYTTALVLIAEAIGYLVVVSFFRRRIAYHPIQAALDAAICAAAFLPALRHVASIAERRGLWQLVSDLQPSPPMLQVFNVYLVLPLLWLGLVAVLRLSLRCKPTVAPLDARLLVLIASWLVVPVAVAWLATYFDVAHLFMYRYLVVSALAAIMVPGICCAIVPGRTWPTVAAIGIFAAAVFTNDMVRQAVETHRIASQRNEDWRGAVERINEAPSSPSLPVLICPGLLEADLLDDNPDPLLREYCLLPVTGIYRIEEPDRLLIPLPNSDLERWRLNDAQRRRLMEERGAWLIIRAPDSYVDRIIGAILYGLDASGVASREIDRQSFGAVTVVRLVTLPQPIHRRKI